MVPKCAARSRASLNMNGRECHHARDYMGPAPTTASRSIQAAELSSRQALIHLDRLCREPRDSFVYFPPEAIHRNYIYQHHLPNLLGF